MGLPSAMALPISAQKITGFIISSNNQPVADAVISATGIETVRSAQDGSFTIEGLKEGSILNIWHEGYYQKAQYLKNVNVKGLKIYLIESNKTRYNETILTPFGTVQNDESFSGISNLNRKDFALGSMSIDNALKGEIAGLQVTNKSGMTGEGAYMALRGIKSLVADNAPLIVINGVPFMPDKNTSQIIGGYSRSIMQALNNKDIRNISVLKGAEASAYGSMGANGVIMIETDQALTTSTDTKISFDAMFGVNWNSKRIPMMNASQYKSYLSDMGLTYYDNMESFFKDFSFMSNPNANKAYLYQYDTDWQDEIFRNASTMDYLFRVEGGDAIAKYNISLGYTGDNGTLKNTNSDRYNAQINASILVSKQFEIQTSINTAYMKGQYQEQGMSKETNPMLTAYMRSPLLNPNKSDIYGNLTDAYSNYYYGAIDNTDFIISNPLALVNTFAGKNRQYDLNAKVQLTYRPMRDMSFNAIVGMYYNYNQEEAFIPGDNGDQEALAADQRDPAVVHLFNQYGEAENTVRVGTNHTFNMYYGLNGNYNFDLNKYNKFAFNAGMQIVTTDYEYDAGFGRHTGNDFYRTLGSVNSLGRYFTGYNNKWNWLNFYAHASYTFDNLVKVDVTAALDGSSSIGKDATRMTLYPGISAVFMAKNTKALYNTNWINKLNIYASTNLAGNSRYSSKLGKYYYTSQPYQTIAGIVRANVPNTKLRAEMDRTINVGFETSVFSNRIQLGANFYDIKATDVLMMGTRSSVLGTSTYYNNDGEINSRGLELTLAAMPVYTKNFKWTVGGTLATLRNKVSSLGSLQQLLTKLSDGASIITRVGANPYAFYGYQTNGVISTTAEAEQLNLKNQSGIAYQAGDIRYIDQDKDGVINDNDKVILGSAKPNVFGSFFSRLEYKNLALDLTFAYSYGAKAYNAVRRMNEASNSFANQTTSVMRRWSMQGQITDMPRAQYNDQIGNNDFSDRFIESTDYIKLRDITLSYTYNRPIWNFIQGATLYVSGQNLVCFTNYLGLDPEFSYSYSSQLQGIDYAKVAAPRSIKIGVNLKF